VKMKVEPGRAGILTGTVEANDVVVLIFNPDPADKFARDLPVLWHHIKNETADRAEELLTGELEAVIRLVEPGRLADHDHLCKAIRNVDDRVHHLNPVAQSLRETTLAEE